MHKGKNKATVSALIAQVLGAWSWIYPHVQFVLGIYFALILLNKFCVLNIEYNLLCQGLLQPDLTE